MKKIITTSVMILMVCSFNVLQSIAFNLFQGIAFDKLHGIAFDEPLKLVLTTDEEERIKKFAQAHSKKDPKDFFIIRDRLDEDAQGNHQLVVQPGAECFGQVYRQKIDEQGQKTYEKNSDPTGFDHHDDRLDEHNPVVARSINGNIQVANHMVWEHMNRSSGTITYSIAFDNDASWFTYKNFADGNPNTGIRLDTTENYDIGDSRRSNGTLARLVGKYIDGKYQKPLSDEEKNKLNYAKNECLLTVVAGVAVGLLYRQQAHIVTQTVSFSLVLWQAACACHEWMIFNKVKTQAIKEAQEQGLSTRSEDFNRKVMTLLIKEDMKQSVKPFSLAAFASAQYMLQQRS